MVPNSGVSVECKSRLKVIKITYPGSFFDYIKFYCKKKKKKKRGGGGGGGGAGGYGIPGHLLYYYS